MIRNYLKISIRSLIRHQLFSGINILGLALGLSAFLLIQEYVNFEKSYDTHYDKADQFYRVSTFEVINDVVEAKDAMATYGAGKVLAEELPEVLDYTVTLKFDELIFRKAKNVIHEKKVISGDSNFLKLFTYRVLQGSAATMLNEPNSLVLTESKAIDYFGEENALGKTIEILGDFNRSFVVTGVIEDIPDNTHYKFDIIMSDKSIVDRFDYNDWDWNNYYVYLRLVPEFDKAALDEKLAAITKKYEGEHSNSLWDIHPVSGIHLTSDFTFEPEMPGNAKAVSFLAIISIFILIIAWVNYINLSTARAVDRAQEVGLRKVVGAFRAQLILQFLFESFMINFLASLLAFIILEASLPLYHSIIGTVITTHVWNHTPILINLAIFFIAGTFVSGLYPALVLSSFKPAYFMKGKYQHSRGGIFLRQGLVVVQFVTSLILIAGTFIVSWQVNYMRGADLGINTEYVVGFPMPSVNDEQYETHETSVETFKEALRNHSAIESVGGTSNLPGGDGADINSTTGGIRLVGIADRIEGTTYIQFIDDHFIETVEMQVIAGRNFDRRMPSDSAAVLVNQAFLKRYNVFDYEDIVNEEIQFGSEESGDKRTIIGVVKDFNRTSLKSSVEPSLYFPWLNPSSTVVSFNSEQYETGAQFLEEKWAEFFPDAPLNYVYLDDRYEKLYEQERRFESVFGTFSILAIVIATLGLFGLSAFIAIRRTKEVGIRKVLGAHIAGIIGLFYYDFLKLIGISLLFGIPAIYYGMNLWLENYAFRIDFPWQAVILSAFIVIAFAFLAVGYQTYRVAILNPAQTLKYE
jgi:putative ABC transport system permease protein